VKKRIIHYSVISLIITASLSACQNENAKPSMQDAAYTFDGVNLIDERIGLSMGHKMLPDQKKMRIYYRQGGNNFCVDKGSLASNDTMLYESPSGWRHNGALFVSSEPIFLSELYGDVAPSKSNYKPENYMRLVKETGYFDIDMSEYYQYRDEIFKVRGKDSFEYLGVSLFPCDNFDKRHARVSGNKTDYLVLPITYYVRYR
jgi:hypothetical protein